MRSLSFFVVACCFTSAACTTDRATAPSTFPSSGAPSVASSEGAEAAAGVDWRPFASIPVSLLAERRQAIGDEGQSAFSITFYGGFSHAVGKLFRIDGYAQAGIVGLRSRDGFVDGSARAVATLGRLEAGGGGWGAAQPGAARHDVGPSLSYRLPVSNSAIRIEADWRFRIAGDARPASGPALVIATDF